MKKFLQKAFAMLVLCLCSMSAMAQEWDVVYYNNFSTNPFENGGANFYTEDGSDYYGAWSWNNTQAQQGPDGYAGILRYTYHGSQVGDAYAVMPGVELKGGKNYRVSFYACSPSWSVERFECVYGTNITSKADFKNSVNLIGNNPLVAPTNVSSASYNFYSNQFTAPADGTYYFAIHAISTKDLYYIHVDNFLIEGEPGKTEVSYVSNDFPADVYPEIVPATLGVTFDVALNTSYVLDPSLVTIDGNAVSNVSYNGTDGISIVLPDGLAVGTHTVALGAGLVESEDGLSFNGANFSFEIIKKPLSKSFTLNAASQDAEGNLWTTFCTDVAFSLPAGYTGYTVTGTNSNAVILQELERNNGTATLSVASPTLVVRENGVAVDRENYIYPDTKTISFVDSNNSVEIVATLGNEYISSWYTYLSSSYINLNTSLTVTAPIGYEISAVRVKGSGTNVLATLTSAPFTYTPSSTTPVYGIEVDYVSDPVIPAYEGILIKGTTSGSNNVKVESGSYPSLVGNLLVGCEEDATWNTAGKSYYKFSLDADNTAGTAGFYWGVDGGASIEAHAGKAYLVLDGAASSNRFLINGFGEETGINAIATESNDAIYNLQGQRVNATAAGIYVKNGKKFIVK